MQVCSGMKIKVKIQSILSTCYIMDLEISLIGLEKDVYFSLLPFGDFPESFPSGTSSKEPACQCRRQETQVQFLGWKDALEEGMTTHSSILAWRIPVDRGAWWATVHKVSKSRTRLKQLGTHAMGGITIKYYH